MTGGSDRPEPGFRPVFAALLAAAVAPLWVSRYLPMIDLPSHLALVHILRHLDDPALPFRLFFGLKGEFTPYVGYYWALRALGTVTPLEVANRLFLTSYVAALAGSTLGLARAMGRSSWLALFSLPLAYTFEFHMGFASYLAALALMMGSLALYAWRLQRRVNGPVGEALLILLPVACLVCHPQPYAFFLAGLGVLVAFFPGARLAALLRAAPSAALFAWWLRGLVLRGRGDVPLTAAVSFDPFSTRIADVGRHLLDQFSDPFDVAILAALAALWAWAMLISSRDRASSIGTRRVWAATILAGDSLAAYLQMPTHAALMQFIHHRYATLTALLMAVAVPLAPGRAPRAWRAVLASACLAHVAYLSVQFIRFDAATGDFRALADRVERGSCVAMVGGYVEGGVMRDPTAYGHFAGYVTLWRDVVPGFTFAGTRHSPFAYLTAQGRVSRSIREAALPEVRAEGRHVEMGTLYAAYGGFYRYFLIPRHRDPKDLFGPAATRLVRIAESGPLALYENPGGRCGT